MREIKFRAWSEPGKQFVALETEFFTGDDGIGELLPPDDIVLMQYTGLKDKNGVEIYEGDVVRNHHATGVVRFESGSFVVNWDGTMFNKIMYFWNDNGFEGEVIGNIYENPELLKGES